METLVFLVLAGLVWSYVSSGWKREAELMADIKQLRTQEAEWLRIWAVHQKALQHIEGQTAEAHKRSRLEREHYLGAGSLATADSAEAMLADMQGKVVKLRQASEAMVPSASLED